MLGMGINEAGAVPSAVPPYTFVFSETDDEIVYPSYMAMDDFIEVESLRAPRIIWTEI